MNPGPPRPNLYHPSESRTRSRAVSKPESTHQSLVPSSQPPSRTCGQYLSPSRFCPDDSLSACLRIIGYGLPRLECTGGQEPSRSGVIKGGCQDGLILIPEHLEYTTIPRVRCTRCVFSSNESYRQTLTIFNALWIGSIARQQNSPMRAKKIRARENHLHNPGPTFGLGFGF